MAPKNKTVPNIDYSEVSRKYDELVEVFADCTLDEIIASLACVVAHMAIEMNVDAKGICTIVHQASKSLINGVAKKRAPH